MNKKKMLSLDADHETPSGLLLAAACLRHMYGTISYSYYSWLPVHMGPIWPSAQPELGMCPIHRYRLGAACTVRSTGKPLQDGLRRTIQAEKHAIATAIVCLETGRLPDEGTSMVDFGSQGAGMLQAQMLTSPACCADTGGQLSLPQFTQLRCPSVQQFLHHRLASHAQADSNVEEGGLQMPGKLRDSVTVMSLAHHTRNEASTCLSEISSNFSLRV